MKLFNKLFGKDEKIRVQFIDCSTGNIVGISNMTAGQLPATFSIETKMTILGSEWQVEEAIPVNSVDFIKTKSLILKLNKIEKINTSNIVFSIPTVSNEFPVFSETALFNDFQVSINDDDLRQYEFLNRSVLPLIDIEVKKISDIIENYSQSFSEGGIVFTKCHARDIIGYPDLNINFKELKDVLGVTSVGKITIYGYDGFVLNNIALTTADTTFYGTLNSETNAVTQLGISSFSENTINEIENIITKFELVFVNWCQCEIITGND
jgi:hypothetical protein